MTDDPTPDDPDEPSDDHTYDSLGDAMAASDLDVSSLIDERFIHPLRDPAGWHGTVGMANQGNTVGVVHLDNDDFATGASTYAATRVRTQLLADACRLADVFGLDAPYVSLVQPDPEETERAAQEPNGIGWPLVVLRHTPDAEVGLVIAPRLRESGDPLPVTAAATAATVADRVETATDHMAGDTDDADEEESDE